MLDRQTEPMKKVNMNEFSCRRGDLTIRGWQYIPDRLDSKKPSAVIISHPFLLTSESMEHYARIISDWGYATFIFDFCGGSVKSRSDGSTKEMTVFTKTEDLMAVFDYVSSHEEIDSDNIKLMGCSLGGFVSAIAATELKEAMTGLIMFYPAFCVPDECRRGDILGVRFDPENIPDVISNWGTEIGKSYCESVLNMDQKKLLPTYKGPVLMTHGSADSIVPASYSVEMEHYYDHCELIIIEGAKHRYSAKQDTLTLEAVKRFLKEN